MKKTYKKPVIGDEKGNAGLPTVLAIGIASAAAAAASVAVGKLVGNFIALSSDSNNKYKGQLLIAEGV